MKTIIFFLVIVCVHLCAPLPVNTDAVQAAPASAPAPLSASAPAAAAPASGAAANQNHSSDAIPIPQMKKGNGSRGLGDEDYDLIFPLEKPKSNPVSIFPVLSPPEEDVSNNKVKSGTVTIVNSGHGENVMIMNDGYPGEITIYNGKGPQKHDQKPSNGFFDMDPLSRSVAHAPSSSNNRAITGSTNNNMPPKGSMG